MNNDDNNNSMKDEEIIVEDAVPYIDHPVLDEFIYPSECDEFNDFLSDTWESFLISIEMYWANRSHMNKKIKEQKAKDNHQMQSVIETYLVPFNAKTGSFWTTKPKRIHEMHKTVKNRIFSSFTDPDWNVKMFKRYYGNLLQKVGA